MLLPYFLHIIVKTTLFLMRPQAVNCYYCPHCTTHIYHHQEVMGPDTIIARTGLLKEGRDKFPVGAEIYGKAKMSWEPKIAETFETLPPE